MPPIQIFDGEKTGPGPAVAVDAAGKVHFVYQNEEQNDLYYIQP